MLRLRPYKPCDAQTITGWCRDELTFRRWTGDRYDKFPVTEADINRKYIDNNGDCTESDNFYPFTAFDENGVVGHFILRYTDAQKSVLRIGFVILDDAKRGMGYGKEMIKLALRYAFGIFGAEKVTIGVFDSNPAAYHCYINAGFREVASDEREKCEICGETWNIIEMEIKKEDFE